MTWEAGLRAAARKVGCAATISADVADQPTGAVNRSGGLGGRRSLLESLRHLVTPDRP
jgi:hypothetical protein